MTSYASVDGRLWRFPKDFVDICLIRSYYIPLVCGENKGESLPMTLNDILKIFFGSKNERDINKLRPIVDKVNSYGDEYSQFTDLQLQAKTVEFKQRLAKGETLDDILPEAFATVREAAWRVIGERPFDVQVMGGIVLHLGRIAEMRTGEGKTLTSTMPIYLNALAGKGVHVVTVNDYLAKRDREWMGPIHEFLGLSVGCIQSNMPTEFKKAAYACDITYGTNNEFGFDYLRDNMEIDIRDKRQRGHHYAIVDEVDSVLIDEARTPLIISGPSEESTEKYYKINKIIPFLNKETEFVIDEKAHTVVLTEAGNKHIEQLLGIDNLYSNQNVGLVHHIHQALRAHHLYKIDVHYIVKDGEVIIVDEFTGRLMPGRRFSEGLHQALEAKEGVRIANENQTLATITFQNYFRLYAKLAGMTGTADTEASEFHQIYKLGVNVIPTNRPMIRKDHPDKIYRTEREKYDAIVNEIAEIHAKGQPVLVGTISIEKSELISKALRKRNIPHNVLNAKFHEKEASIIKQAGRPGQVTIATNMAGRGTDIILGGYPEYKDHLIIHSKNETQEFTKLLQMIIQNRFEEAETFAAGLGENDKEEAYILLAKKALKNFDFERAQKYHDALTLNSNRTKIEKLIKEAQEWKSNHDLVLERGGLFVLGTERHESRRIDNQLRGRAGRQGDPGASCFFISLEDDLMRLFGSERISNVMLSLGMKEGENIQHPWISKSIENAQKKVEERNFLIRKHLLEYDNVMNDQRTFIYKKRDQILLGENLRDDVLDALFDTVEFQLEKYVNIKQSPSLWDLSSFISYLKESFHANISEHDQGGRTFIKKEDAVNHFISLVKEAYEEKERRIGSENMRQLERYIFLQVIDSHWKDHLYAMDTLKEGVGLRGYGQRDPLMEYKFEGFNYFKAMLDNIKKEVSEFIMKMELVEDETPSMRQVMPRNMNIQHQEFDIFSSTRQTKGRQALSPQQGPEEGSRTARSQVVSGEKIGRNEPCPCGSGKKYKPCHGRSA
jgi:preprotein translocase subunit SecA